MQRNSEAKDTKEAVGRLTGSSSVTLLLPHSLPLLCFPFLIVGLFFFLISKWDIFILKKIIKKNKA